MMRGRANRSVERAARHFHSILRGDVAPVQIIPVLDLLEGVVVRAVGGIRSNYRPVVSQLVDETSALAVAGAFRRALGLARLYLADLDAILNQRPNLGAYRALCDDGFEVMVDAGIRSVDEARAVLAAGATAVVAGLETISGPALLGALCVECGPERVVFSLDLRGGIPLGELALWETTDPFEIARRAVEWGVGRMIVLDLASVGVGSGVSTRDLCLRIRATFPELELTTGGGVRQIDDLRWLNEAGIDGVLMASALHDGRITRHDIEALRTAEG